MAFTFPLTVAQFQGLLPMQRGKWKLNRYDELSGLGNGQTLGAELAPPAWGCELTLGTMDFREAAQIQALVESLDGPINTFYFYAPQSEYPLADPTGSLLGSAVPKIASLNANNKELTLNSLPASYVITVGDMLAFTYGTGLRALHRVLNTVTADGTGVTPSIEVRPHIRTGAAVGATVDLVRPTAKAFIVPNSFDPGEAAGTRITGMTFQVSQRP